MKIDMHCHTKEGSIDGKVSIEEYIRMLRNQGFGGMLVTDHDSYGDSVIGKRISKARNTQILLYSKELNTTRWMQAISL